MSLPWVEEHPDVFNDAVFTITAADSLDLTRPTSPVHRVDNTYDQQCAAGNMTQQCEAERALLT